MRQGESGMKPLKFLHRLYESLHALKGHGIVAAGTEAADTTLLQRIPGIGRYRAAQICRYRERLGGYISTAQLREIGDLPEGIEQWFEIGAGETPRQIDVNKSDFNSSIEIFHDWCCTTTAVHI